MKVLVTGGAGFLGSHVLAEMIDRDFDVACFDAVKSPFCRTIAGDLLHMEDVLKATKGVDAVCHLAAIGDVYLALEKPYLASAVNVTGTANLMNACLANGVGKVIYASTWEVYGPPDYEPVDEEHPCRPDHPYSITKLAGEQLALSYDHLRGLPVTALRLGTCYGTRMRGNSVFSIFIDKALAGDTILVQGTGEQSRQFLHADDAARAFSMALCSQTHGEAFNIVPQRSVSIRELAEMIVRRIPTGIEFGPVREGEVCPARISAEKAKSMLCWQEDVPFEEGLEQIILERKDQALQHAAETMAVHARRTRQPAAKQSS